MGVFFWKYNNPHFEILIFLTIIVNWELIYSFYDCSPFDFLTWKKFEVFLIAKEIILRPSREL